MRLFRYGVAATAVTLALGLSACGSDDGDDRGYAGTGGGGATGGTGGATGGTGGGTGGATGGTGGATGGTGGATGGTGGATGGTGGTAGAGGGTGGTGGGGSPDADNDGYTVADGDCDDNDSSVNPGAEEVCNGIDDDCANGIDDGVLNEYYLDADDDNYGVDDPATNQTACEAPSGYASVAGDCDDNEPLAYPGNEEVCDGIDNDCANGIDDGVTLNTYYEDTDQDGFGDDSSTHEGCVPPSSGNWVLTGGDCDDSDPERFPGNPEICDGKDNDCDPSTPEPGATTYYEDGDGDGYGDDASTQTACGGAPSGYVAVGGDCDDSDPDVNPGAIELCDDIDNNCINGVDEGPVETWPDADGDGFGEEGAAITYLCEVKPGTADNDADCDDTDPGINPDAPEIPGNGIDENCDGDDTESGTLCGSDSMSATSIPYHYDGVLSVADENAGGPEGADYYWDDIEVSTEGGEDFTILYHSDQPSSMHPELFVYGPNSCTTVVGKDTYAASNGSPKGNHLAFLHVPDATAGYYYTALTTHSTGERGPYDYWLLPGNLGGSCGSDKIQLWPLGWRSNGTLSSWDNEPSGTPVPSGHQGDDYEFYLEAGEPVTLLVGATNFSDRVILSSASDCSAAIESTSNGPFGNGATVLHYTPTASEVYTAYITSTSSGVTGDYTFNVVPGTLGLECFEGAGSIGGEGHDYVLYPLGGSSTSATLSLTDRSGDFGQRLFDDFETYLEAGDEITIDVDRKTGSYTPRIYLTRPNSCSTIVEQSSESSGDSASLSFTADQAGTYVIVVTSVQWNATGSYTLSTTLN